MIPANTGGRKCTKESVFASRELWQETYSLKMGRRVRRLLDVCRAATRGACLACEAVASKAKNRADSPLCRALGREEAQVLT
jgi:hypothetical protein